MKASMNLFRLLFFSQFRSSPPEEFLRKGVLKICSKFTGQHPCRSAISIKLLSMFSENLFLRTALDGCFCILEFPSCCYSCHTFVLPVISYNAGNFFSQHSLTPFSHGCFQSGTFLVCWVTISVVICISSCFLFIEHLYCGSSCYIPNILFLLQNLLLSN